MNMLILKAAGAVSIFAAGLYLSKQYSARLRHVIDIAREAEGFAAYAYEAILYRNSKISEILSTYTPRPVSSGRYRRTDKKDEQKSFFALAAEYDGRLEEALFIQAAPAYDDETVSIMKDFFSSFGRGYRDSQLQLCELTQKRLQAHIKALEDALPDSLKAGRCICIFTFISILILLL